METKKSELLMGDCRELLAACAREIGFNLDGVDESSQRDALLGLLEAAAIKKIRAVTEAARRADAAKGIRQYEGTTNSRSYVEAQNRFSGIA